MLGRHSYRASERIQASEKVYVKYKDTRYEAVTVDVSDHGLSFFSSSSMDLPERANINLIIKTSRYEAKLEGSVVYVRNEGEGWRYSAVVKPEDENDKRQYMQIIYDRLHSLPKQIDPWVTAYDDMFRNIERRMRLLRHFSAKHTRKVMGGN